MSSRLLKKTHMPIALSIVEGCARPLRFDVLRTYASAHRTSRALPLRSFEQPALYFFSKLVRPSYAFCLIPRLFRYKKFLLTAPRFIESNS